jgi:hypothetical protein
MRYASRFKLFFQRSIGWGEKHSSYIGQGYTSFEILFFVFQRVETRCYNIDRGYACAAPTLIPKFCFFF